MYLEIYNTKSPQDKLDTYLVEVQLMAGMAKLCSRARVR